jgi:hypothetical protein
MGYWPQRAQMRAEGEGDHRFRRRRRWGEGRPGRVGSEARKGNHRLQRSHRWGAMSMVGLVVIGTTGSIEGADGRRSGVKEPDARVGWNGERFWPDDEESETHPFQEYRYRSIWVPRGSTR